MLTTPERPPLSDTTGECGESSQISRSHLFSVSRLDRTFGAGEGKWKIALPGPGGDG